MDDTEQFIERIKELEKEVVRLQQELKKLQDALDWKEKFIEILTEGD